MGLSSNLTSRPLHKAQARKTEQMRESVNEAPIPLHLGLDGWKAMGGIQERETTGEVSEQEDWRGYSFGR